MKFKCRYCKLVFECTTFDEVREVQNTQCWVTMRGVTHSVVGLVN